MRPTLILAGICIALAGCSTAPTPQKCVPPQEMQAGVCVDRQGNDDGQGKPDDPADPAAARKRR